MNISLYILGQLADVQPQELKGEYNLANVGNLSKRLGSKTNQFTLPPTANNRAIFENANETLSNTNLPYTMIPCQLLSDGVDMQFAKLILNSSGDYGFKVTLFDTSASLFDLIKNKELKDLDLRHLNHHWALDSLPQFDDYNSPLTYPITDCQVDSPNAAFPDNGASIYLGVLQAMINENYLIQKIVNESGYALNNIVLNDGYFEDRKPVIPIFRKEIKRDFLTDRYLATFEMNDGTIFVSQQNNSYPSNWLMKNIISQNENYYNITNSGVGTLFNRPFVLPDSLILRVTFQFEIRAATTYNDLVGIEDTNFQFADNSYYTAITTSTSWQTVFIDKYINCFSQNINGDYFFKVVIRPANFGIPSHNVEIRNARLNIIESYNYDDERTQIEYAINRQSKTYITIANNLPKLKQAEFLKEYSLKYGSIILVNDFKKTVTIRPYKDLFNLGNAEDWSGRVDYTDNPEILYQVDKIIGEYLYADNMEEDPATTKPYPKPIGTDLIIDLGNVVKSDKLELKYDATRTIQKPFTSYTAEIAHIPTFESYGYIGSDKTVCLMMREQTGAFEYKDEAVTTINTNTYTTIGRHFTTYFIESANVFNLGFDNQLFQKFYSTISKAINDKPIIIKCFMRLGIDKIANFSGENPVYIKELDGYYIVNKIVTSLNTNDSAEVELIKIKL